jgi:N6-adenosine-specific RNA methylase IME4
MKYDIIIADPPWQYDGKTCVATKADDHYSVTKSKHFHDIDLTSIAKDDTLLFMWCSGPVLKQAIELMEAWGWTYKQTAFVWDKQRVVPGSYTVTGCEFVIVGKRGKIPQPRGSRNNRQLVSELRSKVHSQKPEAIQDAIDQMFPTQDKLELFARRHRKGWTCTGNELDNLDIKQFIEKEVRFETT